MDRTMMANSGHTMDFKADGKLHVKQPDSTMIIPYTFMVDKLYMSLDTVPGDEEFQVQFLQSRTILVNHDSTITNSIYLSDI